MGSVFVGRVSAASPFIGTIAWPGIRSNCPCWINVNLRSERKAGIEGRDAAQSPTARYCIDPPTHIRPVLASPSKGNVVIQRNDELVVRKEVLLTITQRPIIKNGVAVRILSLRALIRIAG